MRNQVFNAFVVWSAVMVELGSCYPIDLNNDDVFHLFDVPTIFRRRRSLPSKEGKWLGTNMAAYPGDTGLAQGLGTNMAAGPGATRLAQGLGMNVAAGSKAKRLVPGLGIYVATGPKAKRLAQGMEIAVEHNDVTSKHAVNQHNHAEPKHKENCEHHAKANLAEPKHQGDCEHHAKANLAEPKHEGDCEHHAEHIHAEHKDSEGAHDESSCTDPDHHHEEEHEEDCTHDAHNLIHESNEAHEKDGHAQHIMAESGDAHDENSESCDHDTADAYHQIELAEHEGDCHDVEHKDKHETSKHVHHIVHRSRDTEFEPEPEIDRNDVFDPNMNEVLGIEQNTEISINYGLYNPPKGNRVADLTDGLPLEPADEIIRADKNDEHSRRRGMVILP